MNFNSTFVNWPGISPIDAAHMFIFAGVFSLVLIPLAFGMSLLFAGRVLGAQVAAAWPAGRRLIPLAGAFVASAVFIALRIGDFTGMFHGNAARFDGSFGADVFFSFADGHPDLWLTAVGQMLARLLLPPLALLFVVKIYTKWITGPLTAEEQQPGATGFRAWFDAANLVTVLALSACLSLAFNIPFFLALPAFACLLAAYPAARTFAARVPTTSTPASSPDVSSRQSLDTDRERVLRLLEQDRISADEAAELLTALAATATATPAPAEPWTPARKLLTAGAAVCLLAFFLPWYTVDLQQEINRVSATIAAQSFTLPGMPAPAAVFNGNQIPFPNTNDTAAAPSTSTISTTGGDMHHGLGWIALVLGLAPAFLPFITDPHVRPHRRPITLACLAAGGIILLYLIADHPRYVSIGLPLACVGYAIELLATVGLPTFPARALPSAPPTPAGA